MTFSLFFLPPHISGANMKSGQTCLWIIGNIYWQEKAEIAIPNHHIRLLGAALSMVNCYVVGQQVAEEAPSRKKWIRDRVAYTPPERIMNEATKEHEQFPKIRTEILAARKKAFFSEISPPMPNMSGESLCCASRRCSTDLKTRSQERE